MSKRGDIYHGNRKIGEIHEVRDYEGELAVGIVGCLVQLALYALVGIFILTWRYPKVMLPLLAVVIAMTVFSGSIQNLQLWTVLQPKTRVAPSAVVAATKAPSAVVATVGIVTTDRLNVRTGPRADYNVIRKLSKDDKVAVQSRDETGDWLNISFSGTTGWVATKYIALQTSVIDIPLATSSTATTDVDKPLPNVYTLTTISSDFHPARWSVPYGQ